MSCPRALSVCLMAAQGKAAIAVLYALALGTERVTAMAQRLVKLTLFVVHADERHRRCCGSSWSKLVPVM